MVNGIKKFGIEVVAMILLSLPWGDVFSQERKTNLPAVFINVDNRYAVSSKDNYVSGKIEIKSAVAAEELSMVTEIRGRGHSTWSFPKKPYRIKLEKKHNVLNLPTKARSWTLLANYADKTLMRNALAMKISEVTGLDYTPSSRFVDLVLNGNYLGNYWLSDQVQVHEDRVDVDELTSEDVDDYDITGGYLLEIDGFAASEPVWFSTAYRGMPIRVKSPDDDQITAKQLNYIVNYVNNFERILFSATFDDPVTGYRAKVDTSSLINWYIASELTGNPDAFWSTNLYKKRGVDKLFFGPLWDFDIAFNNDSRLGNATQKLMRQHAHQPRTWIERRYEDKWFQLAVWNRWNELVNDNLTKKLTDYIISTAQLIDQSQQLNFGIWKNLNQQIYLEQNLFNTYSEGVNYLISYIDARVKFLSSAFAYVEPEKPSEPFVPEEAFYMIANKRTNNVIDVSDGSKAENAPLVAWAPLPDDDGQLWEIAPAGGDTYRFINKHSGLAMTGNGHNTNLIQKTVSAGDNKQRWRILPVNTGNFYGIVNVQTGYSINNSGGGLNNGNPVIEYTNAIVNNNGVYSVSSENQQWYIQMIEKKYVDNELLPSSVQIMAVYPVPTSDRVNVKVTLEAERELSITLHNLFGQAMYAEQKPAQMPGIHTYEIPLRGFEPGIYILTLSTDQGERTVRKIIVGK
jgi:hypothetical protein